MYESELSIGLLGWDDQWVEKFQKIADAKKYWVSFSIVNDIKKLEDYQAIIHKTNDIASIAKVQQYLSSYVIYFVIIDDVDRIPEELLDRCDHVFISKYFDKNQKLFDFYLTRMMMILKKMDVAWENENCLNTVMNMIPELMWFKDLDGRYLRVNHTFSGMFGRPKDDFVGRDSTCVCKDASDVNETVCSKSDNKVIETKTVCQFKEHVRSAKGILHELKTYKAPVFDRKGEMVGVVGVARDVTRENQLREGFLNMTRKDYLTGLSNRRDLYSYIKKNWHTGQLAILYCDLDGFKHVNDTYGHAAGDRALIEVAKALNNTLDETMVARVGGDEFLAAFVGNYRVKDICDKCEGINFQIERAFAETPEFREMSISIGVATTQYGEKTVDEVMACADRAMYEAKKTKHQKNRKCYHVYDPSLSKERK